MKKTICILMGWMCLLVASSPALAQVNVGDKGQLSGLVFGDYYWMASNHNNDIEGQNGFWIRRIYLTYDREISDSFSSRVRLEMSSAGDFTTSAKMTPVVKDAYLKWKNDTQQVLVGISSTPTFGLTEDIWKYRSVEKTPLDLQNFGSSRDFGIAARGQLTKGGSLAYHVMIGNGNGNKNEIDKGKKVMLALTWKLADHVVVQGYGDWNDRPDNTDELTGQGLIAYRSEDVNVGFLYAFQKRRNAGPGNADVDVSLVSLFAHGSLSENISGLLRVDHVFDPNPGVASNDYIPFYEQAESTLLIGGVDVSLDPKVHLIPNIESVIYGKPSASSTPKSDLIPRLTLFYTF